MSDSYMGEIKAFGFQFAPRNFALCQGALIAISQNTALFSLLGTFYGGNGQTTFQLPNLGGRLAIGQGQSPGTSSYVIGQVGGNEHATLLITNMPIHTHTMTGTVAVTTTVNTVSSIADQAKPGGFILAKGKDNSTGAVMFNYSDATSDSTLGGVGSTVANTLANATAGGSQPFGIQAPYLAINYCICTAGIFPSRN